MFQTKIIEAQTPQELETNIKTFLHNHNFQNWTLQGGPFTMPVTSSVYPLVFQMLVLHE